MPEENLDQPHAFPYAASTTDRSLSTKLQSRVLLELDTVLKAIDDEPEFPGEAPRHLKAIIKKAIADKDEDLVLHIARQSVRLTKECIANRVKKLPVIIG